MADVYVDIDVDDFLTSCSENEKQEIIGHLIDDGYLDSKQDISSSNNNILDWEWEEILDNLKSRRLQISREDEEIIKRISKKY